MNNTHYALWDGGSLIAVIKVGDNLLDRVTKALEEETGSIVNVHENSLNEAVKRMNEAYISDFFYNFTAMLDGSEDEMSYLLSAAWEY